MKKDKPVIAHFLREYLPATATFIYHPLKHFTRVEPVIIADRVLNLDEFYFPRVYSLSLSRSVTSVVDDYFFCVFSKRPLKKLYQWRKLIDEEARLIHAHFGWAGWQSTLLKRLTGLPLVVTFYGADAFYLPILSDLAEGYERMFSVVDRVLVEGPHMRQRIIELGCPPEKVNIHPISIDLELFDFKERSCPSPDHPINVLMCGRFVEKKGFIEGIRAFAEAVSLSSRPVELSIIGDGELRPQLEHTIAALDLQHCVRLLGSLSYDEYIKMAKKAHIFMAPSQTAADGDSEGGAPTVLLEMQALGVPIISTFHADIPHVVRHGQSGLLSPEFDSQRLAENLTNLIEAPQRWGTMGRNGRAFVEMRHNLAINVSRLEDLYFELMGQRG